MFPCQHTVRQIQVANTCRCTRKPREKTHANVTCTTGIVYVRVTDIQIHTYRGVCIHVYIVVRRSRLWYTVEMYLILLIVLYVLLPPKPAGQYTFFCTTPVTKKHTRKQKKQK